MYLSSRILHLAEVDKEDLEHITQISWIYHPILESGHFHLAQQRRARYYYGPELLI
jgi:hypothetical protein